MKVLVSFVSSILFLIFLSGASSGDNVAPTLATADLGKKIGEEQTASWMYSNNIINGYNSTNQTFTFFQPDTSLSRVHAVTPMYNYHKNVKLKKSLKKKESAAISKLNQLYKDKEAFVDLILSYEQQFSSNSYLGNQTLPSPVEVIHGNGQVILSAPHSTKHIREGNTKDADVYTGSLALLLHELTDKPVIFTTQIAEDANYIENGIYKDTLRKLVDRNNGKYVIDLHGAASTRPFEIDLGTINGKSINHSDVETITRIFQTNNIQKIEQDHTFKGVTKGTIVNYSFNQLHINSVQIEINKKYRNPKEDIDSYYQLVKSLIEIIEMLD